MCLFTSGIQSSVHSSHFSPCQDSGRDPIDDISRKLGLDEHDPLWNTSTTLVQFRPPDNSNGPSDTHPHNTPFDRSLSDANVEPRDSARSTPRHLACVPAGHDLTHSASPVPVIDLHGVSSAGEIGSERRYTQGEENSERRCAWETPHGSGPEEAPGSHSGPTLVHDDSMRTRWGDSYSRPGEDDDEDCPRAEDEVRSLNQLKYRSAAAYSISPIFYHHDFTFLLRSAQMK